MTVTSLPTLLPSLQATKTTYSRRTLSGFEKTASSRRIAQYVG